MSSMKVYLLTGANRGIGLGLSKVLLSRPKTTVIATVRNLEVSRHDLEQLPIGPGSNLIIETLASDSDSSASTLVATLQTKYSILHIDIIIANAGTSAFHSTLTTPLSSLREHFEVNTLGPICLFQATYPLLSKSLTPKFIVMSSILGSIAQSDPIPTLAYGISKASVNYFVRQVHVEHPELVTVAIHPGWLKSENGQKFADAVGIKEPPMMVDEVSNGILAQIDDANKSTTSGCFLSHKGEIIPW